LWTFLFHKEYNINVKKFKVIAADIDGTITKYDHTTSKINIEAIRKLHKSGYLFGLASGRPVQDLMNKYKEWNLDFQFDFIIGWNGCELYDDKTKKTYKYNYLSTKDIKEIIKFMSSYDCNIHMYLDNKYLSSKETDRAWYSAFKNKREFVVVENIEEFYKKPNGGIMFRASEEEIRKIEFDIKDKIIDKDYVGFKTQSTLIEFAHKDCNKGYALNEYCKLHNIPLNECIAFGDTSNDNQMLSICYGVCLKNGSNDTKSCAKIITDKDCDNDGFADYVSKHLL